MSSATESQNKLLNALSKFERSVEQPIVPGELSKWSENVANVVAQVDFELKYALQRRHEIILREIAQEDAGLENRVEQLKKEDAELLPVWKKIQAELTQIRQFAATAKPVTAQVRARVEQLVQDSIQLVVRARIQEIAINTWHTEAFYRDRGVVD